MKPRRRTNVRRAPSTRPLSPAVAKFFVPFGQLVAGFGTIRRFNRRALPQTTAFGGVGTGSSSRRARDCALDHKLIAIADQLATDMQRPRDYAFCRRAIACSAPPYSICQRKRLTKPIRRHRHASTRLSGSWTAPPCCPATDAAKRITDAQLSEPPPAAARFRRSQRAPPFAF